jgi:threonine/homoserine/homoserine lactone efflux protein
VIELGPWLAFLGLSAIAVLTPGPTLLSIVGNAVSRGFRATVPMVLGNAVGIATMMATATAGVAGALSRAGPLWLGIQLAGAAYLAWHGFQTWRGGTEPAEPRSVQRGGNPFARGVLLVWSNPKAIIFFGAVLPQFVHPGHPVALQLVTLATTFIALELTVTTSAALAAGRVARAQGSGSLRGLRRAGGLILMGSAVLLGVATLSAAGR